MTSRKRKNISTVSSKTNDLRKFGKERLDGRKLSRNKRRRHLLETLEPRQLLAGPQLIGIQPNVGELIVEGSTVETAPRVLTLRFDQDQNIDPSTFDGVKISRAGDDGALGTSDDIVIQPGLVTLADNASNEVVVRFSEALPDDQYQVEVFGYDDPSKEIVGLRNTLGELLQPRVAGQRIDTTRFNLKLGALIEAVIPQPVVRQPDGKLQQNRDEIVVYFNEDPMFVEHDDAGNPTIRSVEHPRFYQLFLTQGTVRNSDDALYHPDEVIYDEATHTARLIFADDINELGPDVDGNAGVPLEGGTFRLRIGTAVDDRLDVILPPLQTTVVASAVVDFGVAGLSLRFTEQSAVGEGSAGRQISFINSGGAAGLSHTLAGGPLGAIVFDLGGAAPSVQALSDYITANLSGEIALAVTPQNTADLTATLVPARMVDSPAITLVAVGDTLQESFDIGVFGQIDPATGTALKSVLLSETIDPQTVVIQPVGSDSDPGSDDRFSHINPNFGADDTAGVTTIDYNFEGIFATDPITGTNYLNQITEVQKTRIREALDLWSSNIGVQFRETSSDGITFAVGDDSRVQPALDADLTSAYGTILNATLRIPNDPNVAGYDDAALVFDKSIDFNLDYGEDFTRKSVAGIGLLLGLEAAPDLLSMSDAGDLTVRGDSTPTIMGLSSAFLNSSIQSLSDLEPVFPNNYDVLHGQYLHRTDSVDIDLYRFVVDLDDPTQVGTLTAETFSERLADSSLLDTELTLFEEVSAGVLTDLGLGSDMGLQINSLMPGRLGNNSSISFVQSDRFEVGGVVDTEIRVLQTLDQSGNPSPNGILVDLPRLGPNVSEVLVGDLVDAINNHPFASSIFRAAVVVGDANTNIVDADLTTFSPLLLSGGGLQKIHRNDDYFGEDSRIIASLGEGVYYLGVAASGNDQYDPTISGTGNGGRTQGDYELHLKFEPQVDELDVLRDQDSDRVGVPGTPLDGDGDGVPGGIHNFWFETRALERRVTVEGDGQRAEPGQVMTIVGGGRTGRSEVREYEFVTVAGGASPGNIEVLYSPIDTPADVAGKLQAAINTQTGNTGVSVDLDLTGSTPVLEFEGERSVELSSDFSGMEVIGRTIFVDKLAGPFAEGTLDRPFNNIANTAVANAFGSSAYGDIVRIVGNGGLDNDITTEADNLSYQIGTSETGGGALTDGRSMNVPSGVTTMIDAGAVFKLRNSYINVGSSTVQVDRSNGALQVLGTPRLVDLSLSGDPIVTTLLGDDDQVSTEGYSDGSVIFTSTRDRLVDTAASGISPAPSSGNWGGLVFRRDVDRAEGRRDREDEGIFLQTVNHAEIRYGGGSNVLIDSVQQLVNPIQIVDMRPTVTFNTVTFSADSAISAAPNSFEETSFQAPQYQQGGVFTADYDRIGPDIHNNLLVENSINGLFIRVTTTPVDPPKEFTVAARFDDTDIVHYVAENLTVVGSPGGSVQDDVVPTWQNVTWQPLSSGLLNGGDTYEYKLTYVDADGFESAASAAFSTTIPASFTSGASVELTALPTVGGLSEYVSRRLYRADPGAPGDYYLVAYLDAGSVSFIDEGSRQDAILDPLHEGVRGRLDASLVMDAGLIFKLRGSRIELGHGTQLLAEADETNPIVFTSSLDDRFGVGGTFDTNNDGNATLADRGDWSGVYAGPNSTLSFDYVVLANAGGISLLRGGLARGFAPVELTQAEGRITNSRFETNDTGQDGAGPAGRYGLLSLNGVAVNDPAARSHVRDAISTIMVRGSQPVIVGNTFYDNRGTIINIDIESMGADHRVDPGRSTGDIERFSGLDDNYGPLIRYNRYDNVVFEGPNQGDNNSQLSGLEVRAGQITTETIFDDTDIAHLLFDNIEVGNFHSSGGLRLMSRPDESLVVKFSGPGTPNSANEGTGITASGQLGNTDRIAGAVHILGLPGAPVVLTSLHDDSVGAGMSPDGSSFTDHDGDGVSSRPMPNDWRGIYLDQYSNDNNILVVPELELLTEVPPGLNASVDNAQYLGELAKDVITADHARRAGFEVDGYLGGTTDIDAYSFTASPGTPVWIDLDSTSFTLDTVIEILDANGTVLARSDNSFDETMETDPAEITIFDPTLRDGVTSSLQVDPEFYTERNDFELYADFGSYNPRDAGIHLSLPGNSTDPSARSVYFVRVRSASLNPDDAAGGITGGHYRMQVRLTEEQAFPGSLVRFADIRYANNAIHAQGLMSNSPLLGEAQENEVAVRVDLGATFFGPIPLEFGLAYNNIPVGGTVGSGAQYVGNLSVNDQGVIGIGGSIGNPPEFLNDPFAYNANDVDFYQFDVTGVESTVLDIDFADGYDRYDTNISIFYDADGVPEVGNNTHNDAPFLIFFGTAANVLDDLPSAMGEESELEKLVRGSLTTNDPFIGPVALPGDGTGTYYVAITESDRQPTSLTQGGVVREPINSVTRLIEDRFGVVPEVSTTDDAGVTILDLFDSTSLPFKPSRLFPAIPGEVFVTTQDSDFGHGKPEGFVATGVNGSLPDPAYQYPTPTPEFAPLTEPADDFPSTETPAKQPALLDNFPWSLVQTDTIGTAATLLGGSVNTSTTIAHLSVSGVLNGDEADLYQISIPAGGGELTIDIDNGFDMGASVDTKYQIFNLDFFGGPQGAFFGPVVNDSVMVEDGMLGSLSLNDPFGVHLLPQGSYLIGVMGQTATVGYNPDTPQLDIAAGPEQGDYIMRLSLEPKAATLTSAETPEANNRYLQFDRRAVIDSTVVYDETHYSLFTDANNNQFGITNLADSFTVRYVDDADDTIDLPATATYDGFSEVLTVNYNSLAATLTNRDFAAIWNAIQNAAGLPPGSFVVDSALPNSPVGTTAFPALEIGEFYIDYRGEEAVLNITGSSAFGTGASNGRIDVSANNPAISDFEIVFDDTETDNVPPRADWQPAFGGDSSGTLTITYNPNLLGFLGGLNSFANVALAIQDVPGFEAELVGFSNGRLAAVASTSEHYGTVAKYSNTTTGHDIEVVNNDEEIVPSSFRLAFIEDTNLIGLNAAYIPATGTLLVTIGSAGPTQTYDDVITAINNIFGRDFTATLTGGAGTDAFPIGQTNTLPAAVPFDLDGYVAADQPYLYFNRYLDLGVEDVARITIQSAETVAALQPPTELVVYAVDGASGSADVTYYDDPATVLQFNQKQWQQERIDLSPFAGHTDIVISVEYTNGISVDGNGVPVTATGLGLDDFIVGFAERGEQIFRAPKGTSFEDVDLTNPDKPPYNGEYQLEIRKASEFASEEVDPFGNLSVSINSDFDTNDRLTQTVTMVVPGVADVGDGETFLLSDGVTTQLFEFDDDGSVEFGNIRVDFVGLTTTAELAGAIRGAINGQSVVAIEATTTGGLDGSEAGGGAPTGDRLALSGAKFGSFEEAALVAGDLPAGPLNLDAEGNLLMPVIFYDEFGDTNHQREQGVVLIEHNQISDVRGIGVWSEPGERQTSPYQDDFLTSGSIFDLYLPPPVANTTPGAVINFPELNDHILGGIAPGIVIQSNTIDQAQYSGIKIDGQTAPWVIETGTGDTIVDGSTFVIDAAGTRVVFEFEEIGDGAKQTGANEHGGDGIKDGHVPVYYRHNDDALPATYLLRATEYSELEMAHAIREAIQGSILMTNGLVELVEVSVGPSLTTPFYTAGPLDSTGAPVGDAIPTPALYIQGATAIYPNPVGFGGIPDVGANILAYQAPVAEAPQPFARIVNNTIFGDDGTRTVSEGSSAEPNDLFVDAVDTRISGSHRDAYTVTAVLGDNGGLQAPTTDVDFYRVYLEVGDRLVADIDTNGAGNPDASLQIFDASGSVQSFVDSQGVTRTISSNDTAPAVLIGNGEPGNNVDPFIDFVAPKSGVYFVGVSSEGNDSYSGRTLANRKEGFGGTGTYTLSLKSYAPRSFVMSFDNAAPNGINDADIDQAAVSSLVGTTFTVTTIEDIPAAFPQGNGTNQVTFQFTGGGNVTVNGAGVIGVPIAGFEVHDLMKGIEAAINFAGLAVPVLPNYINNGTVPGAVRPGVATALGGVSGQTQVGDELPWYFWEQIGPPLDNNVVQPENGVNAGFGNWNSESFGTTELYALIENVAEIQLSAAAIAAGLRLDPIAGEDADQLLNETGVMVAGGASPTILNNIFMNLHEAVAVESSNAVLGLGLGRQHAKPAEVIVVGNIFQDNFLNNANITNAQSTIGVTHSSLTGWVNGTSNVNGGSDDFNITLSSSDLSLQHPEANNFQPAYGSIVIDSSVNSLIERDGYAEVRASVGLGVTNVLAPTHDVSGVLRADHPDFASLGGIGASVFKDRGSVELADFVGPIAIAEMPRDNDAAGVDSDSTTSVINLQAGTYKEFRIQLRDNGDSSDPFTGIGIDDSTVVVPVLEGLRPAGSNVTLLENDRLLTEGVDYTFFYDETRKLITLTPLTGVWQNDRSYRIEINNQDRDVLIAPSASAVTDGDQLTIVDSQGADVIFEFESGYSIIVPEPITLVVPRAGTDVGGLSDGDLFQINDGVNSPVIFEFNTPGGAKLPGTIEIPLSAEATPGDEAALQVFLTEIAQDIAAAINDVAGPDSLDVDARVLDNRVVVGGEAGTTAITTLSGLSQLSRTLGLQVPLAGVGPGGIQDGDSFRIDLGSGSSVGFEFDTDANITSAQNRRIDISGVTSPEDVAGVIRDAILAANVGLQSVVDESNERAVYLNLPASGGVDVIRGRLEVVGLSRIPDAGDEITITPSDGGEDAVIEIQRGNTPDVSAPTEDGRTTVTITRVTTGDELSGLIAEAIGGYTAESLQGLNQNEVTVIPGGLLAVGGREGLELVTNGYSMSVTGSPSVTGASTLSIDGSLILNLPLVGGGGIIDGSVLQLDDDFGNTTTFEFNEVGTLPELVGSIPINYNPFDTVDDVAVNLVNAINSLTLGITAVNQTGGRISLGRITEDRVNLEGIQDPDDPSQLIRAFTGASLRREIVRDGEVIEITQGDITVRYEFETASGGGGVGAGNIAVPFQPNSTSAQVAASLAASINNNLFGLTLNAVVVLDSTTGEPTGSVSLNDTPGTLIDVTAAPTLALSGVPGGATPIQYSPSFGSTEMKFAMINAINSVNVDGEPAVTPITAVDRGGSTFFVSNAEFFAGVADLDGYVKNFFLPGVKDEAGNLLKANRSDLTTQFTILMPTASFDYGDAPDPLYGVAGRYPTTSANNGPRHVLGGRLKLGTKVDANPDGLPGISALRDDLAIGITSEGTLFNTSFADGRAVISINTDSVDPLTRDGDTITIDLGTVQSTLEFDVATSSLGAFDEDNFAIRPSDPTSASSIADAIRLAIIESPLQPADVSVETISTTEAKVTVGADDEDGVIFVSEENPYGVLNRGVATPIEVSVTGGGILEAWIDFNADGDWDDPGEQIIPQPSTASFDALRSDLLPEELQGVVSNVFSDTGGVSTRTYGIVVPETAPIPPTAITTYARFRVSKEGGLTAEGLALSGEVEDYAIQILPGLPPQVSDQQSSLSYTATEDTPLSVSDVASGLLNGITDPDGDLVEIFAGDVGLQTVTDAEGVTAGVVTINANGTFSYAPAADYFGTFSFTARVTDIHPGSPETQLVSPTALTVTVTVDPDNDAPVATPAAPVVSKTIFEDAETTFTATDLIDPFYQPGPANESDQDLVFFSAFFGANPLATQQGGTLALAADGKSVTYTPPADHFGTDEFSYQVSDVPAAGQTALVSANIGTVQITLTPQNDPPRPGDDSVTTQENVPATIAIADLLNNDTAGPANETGQLIEFVSFDSTSVQGGTIVRVNDDLIYTPANQFSGADSFTYRIAEVGNSSSFADGTVNITVEAVNDPPAFIGKDGVLGYVPATDDLSFVESKAIPQTRTYDLNTWFTEPDSESMTFTVSSSDPASVVATVVGAGNNTLQITLPSYAGSATPIDLTITATDSSVDANSTSQTIQVSVADTPDGPQLDNPIGTITVDEDTPAVAVAMSSVFSDPDGDTLQYSVAQLGSLVNPTVEQIAEHPFVQSISFPSGVMQIVLKPNANGSTVIAIAASDGTASVTDTFTLNVTPLEDDPIAVDDVYSVALGSVIQIQDTQFGLIANDSDPDGDAISVDVAEIVYPTKGTLTVNPSGIFVYTNTAGQVGETDTFRYRVTDGSRFSEFATVTINLTSSTYQNPILAADVNADGRVSAIDALRVINFLNRRLTSGVENSVPVNEIGSAPPDYLDVNGNGSISASDALVVINELATINNSGGEMVVPFGTTTSYAAGTVSGLPITNFDAVENTVEESVDEIFSGSLEVESSSTAGAADWFFDSGVDQENAADASDEALSSLLGDDDLQSSL